MSVSLSIATSSSDDTSTVVLTSIILCVTIAIVLLIICVTVLILKWIRKKDSTVHSNGVQGREDDQQNKAWPTIQCIPEQNEIDYQRQSKGHGTLS